jgi:alcohol dehydrogenase, propanol-preferring
VVLTRGERHRQLAEELGAAWVGDGATLPPEPCDRAVVFAPAGALVPVALRVIRAGGTVSLAGIHMSPIPSFDYDLLWGERSLRSVANMTRRDAEEFLTIAAAAPVRAEIETFPLEAADDALLAVARDAVRGAAVLTVAES